MEAYRETLELISGMCLEPFHRATGAEIQKDLTGSEDFVAAVKHAVEVVNAASVVDMKTFNFNLKLHRVATQAKNLPLPPCKYIIPLAHSYWNRVKGGSDINTQQLWENNFVTPVHSLHCSVVKQLGILQPVYQIHRLSQVMSNGVENLESFSSAMTYRKHLRSGHPMWWTIRSVEEDIQSMIRRYDVPRPPSLAGPAGGSPVVVRNPMGVGGIKAVIGKIGAPKSGKTPQRKVKKWYANHREKPVTKRRHACVGRWTVPVSRRPQSGGEEPRLQTGRGTCAACGKDNARVWCSLCHHWFHGKAESLPAGEDELIAVPTGERDKDGRPKYTYVENNCFHIWHTCGRESARKRARAITDSSSSDVADSEQDAGDAGDGVGAEDGDSTGDDGDGAAADANAGESDSGRDGDEEDNVVGSPGSDGAGAESSDGPRADGDEMGWQL